MEDESRARLHKTAAQKPTRPLHAQLLANSLNNLVDWRERALSHIAARKFANTRANQLNAARGKRRKVRLGCGVFIHMRVHRGAYNNRTRRCQKRGGHHIVGNAVGKLRDDVRRRGCHADDVGLLAQA